MRRLGFGGLPLLAILLFGGRAGEVLADVWPRFRGPNGSATAQGVAVPLRWDQENVLWKTSIPGTGNSSVAVWEDHLFATTAEHAGRHRLLLCLDTVTGQERWRAEFEFETHPKHRKNAYATATPATDGERVYAIFTSQERHEVHCFDVAGKHLWKRDLGPFVSQHGSGASPILYKDRLIVPNDQDGQSFIAAIDKRSGNLLWSSPRVTEKAAYSTPFVFQSETEDQVIFSSMMGLTSLDPNNGAQNWVCDLFTARTVGSPFQAAGLVCATCGGGGRGIKLIAVKPDGNGDVATTHLAWESTKIVPYCPTPVCVGTNIFLVTDQGIARCLDASTGQEVWRQRLGGNFAASPVRVNNDLFFLSEAGNVFVLAAQQQYQLLAKNKLDDYFVSTPAVANGRMFLRGEEYLWCIGNR